MKHNEITEKIIKAFFTVYNTLGYGFLEKVYENALYFELKEMGFNITRQHRVLVYYKNYIVGEYIPDLVVEDLIICELKAYDRLYPGCELQLINYLKATSIEVGLLFNFGRKPEFKRRIFDNVKRSGAKTG